MKWYTYVALCRDNSFYTGITTSIKRRELLHNKKLGAKSLFGKLPVKIVYNELYETQKQAAKREKEIKGWRRDKKLSLIQRST